MRDFLEDEPVESKIILTVRGQGYRFIGNIVEERKPRYRIWLIPMLTAALCFAALLIFWGRPQRQLTVGAAVQITSSGVPKLAPILTDGPRLYYDRFVNRMHSIWVVSSQGGEEQHLDFGVSNTDLCDLSPDGSTILFRTVPGSREEDGQLYVASAVGRDVRPVPGTHVLDAAFEPGSDTVLYSTSNNQIWRCSMDGSNKVRLAAVAGRAYWFRWSPDRRYLRYTLISAHSSFTSLWEADSNAQQAHLLLPSGWKNSAAQCCGAFTPDGRFYLFQAKTIGTFEMWCIRNRKGLWNRTPTPPFQLTFAPSSYLSPEPSKDGNRLFVRTISARAEVLRYDEHSHQFVPYDTPSGFMAAFSRDWKWLAYVAASDFSLWRCRSDGAACAQLVKGDLECALPAWSPDGNRIAFMGRRGRESWRVYVIPASGGVPLRLTRQDENEADAGWTPDGRYIVYGGVPVLEGTGHSSIYKFDTVSGSREVIPGSEDFFSPRLSRDGKLLLAVSRAGSALVLFDFRTRSWRVLTKGKIGYPNWTQDDKYVVFLDAAPGQAAIDRVRIKDGLREQIATIPFAQSTFIFGTWIGLAADDSPLVTRDMNGTDIYALSLFTR